MNRRPDRGPVRTVRHLYRPGDGDDLHRGDNDEDLIDYTSKLIQRLEARVAP